MESRAYIVAAAAIASPFSANAAPVRINVDELVNDGLAFHGTTIATASSNLKLGQWTLVASQSYLEDNVASNKRTFLPFSLGDIQRKGKSGFRDTRLSAKSSYKLSKRMKVEVTLSSRIPTGGPFGTKRMDNSADAMVEGSFGSNMVYWAGVTQHMRRGDMPLMREYQREYYGGFSRSLTKLTSLRWDIYRAQSEGVLPRPTTSMSMSLDHQLPEVGSFGVSLLSSKYDWSEDERASVSLRVDKLPF